MKQLNTIVIIVLLISIALIIVHRLSPGSLPNYMPVLVLAFSIIAFGFICGGIGYFRGLRKHYRAVHYGTAMSSKSLNEEDVELLKDMTGLGLLAKVSIDYKIDNLSRNISDWTGEPGELRDRLANIVSTLLTFNEVIQREFPMKKPT